MVRLTLEQHSSTLIDLRIFRNVANIPHLTALLKSGKLGSVLLNEGHVISPFHLGVAVNRALCSRADKTMKTRSISTEIMLCLSPNNNISQSLATFGLGPSTDCVVSVSVAGSEEELAVLVEEVKRLVIGDKADFGNEFNYCKEEVCRIYNVSKEELLVDSLENTVVTKIATKV